MKRLLGVLLMASLLLAACGGGGSPTATPAPAAAAPAAEEPAAEEPVAGSAQEAIAQVLEVAMHDIYFGENTDNINNPPEWTVDAGADVTVNLNNMGALEHDWAVVQLGAEVPTPFLEENKDVLIIEAGLVPPGQTDTFSFTAPTEPGIYTVICTVPGHYPVMQGRLVVN